MELAYHNLVQDKLRFFLSVSGVALAVMLILLLNGFLLGINRQVTSYLDHMPGTVNEPDAGIFGVRLTGEMEKWTKRRSRRCS